VRLPPLQLGPWPQGQDTFHNETHAVFQPGEQRLARLSRAVNVDLDDEGWPKRRAGTTLRIALTGSRLFANNSLVLVQDETSILSVDPSDWSTTELVSGLSGNPIVFHEHAGQVFWTDGTSNGRITLAGTALNWGCSAAPTPTLGTTAGNLRAGRYLVAATFIDSSGVEHAASKAAVAALDGTTDLTVNLSAIDANAAYVKIYCSKPNGTELFFCSQVAVNALPATITSIEVSEEPLRTQLLSPPIPADVIFSYRGLLMLGVENAVFPSYGLSHHLFDIAENLETRPENVIAGAGLDTGFWTLTANGAFWTEGKTPESWETWQRSSLKFSAGALVISGEKIPKLQTSKNIALFVSNRGLVAGLTDGTVVQLTPDQTTLDVASKSSSIVYRISGDLRQILFTLE